MVIFNFFFVIVRYIFNCAIYNNTTMYVSVNFRYTQQLLSIRNTKIFIATYCGENRHTEPNFRVSVTRNSTIAEGRWHFRVHQKRNMRPQKWHLTARGGTIVFAVKVRVVRYPTWAFLRRLTMICESSSYAVSAPPSVNTHHLESTCWCSIRDTRWRTTQVTYSKQVINLACV